MSIKDVARQLYGLAPEEFTRARNARAKEARAAGDTELAVEVQALRKPTTGAWLLNQLVRRNGDEVQQVLDLGARLRAAQGTLGADELRGLDRQRRELTRAVAQQAGALGRQVGRRVTDQVTVAMEETLRSAMVDEAAGAALSTGLLTDTFSATGIEPVDLSGVVALAGPAAQLAPGRPGTSPPEDEAPDTGHRRRLAEAQRAVAAAESTLEAARAAAERSREQATDARRGRESLEAERAEVRRRLRVLDEQVAAAAAAEGAATRAQEHAARDEAAASEAADRLRERLEGLANAPGPSSSRPRANEVESATAEDLPA